MTLARLYRHGHCLGWIPGNVAVDRWFRITVVCIDRSRTTKNHSHKTIYFLAQESQIGSQWYMEILPIPNKQIEPYTFLILFIPEHAQRFVYTVRARLLDLSMPMQAEFLCLPGDGKN